jgi:hypothetical protein
MLGKDSISLPNFQAQQSAISPWNQQKIKIVPADVSDSEVIHELRRHAQSSRWTWIGASTMLALGALLSVSTYLMGDRRELPVAPIDWRVTSISEAGLVIRAGDSEVTIPVGSHLPNGEALLATSTTTNSFTTDVGTTRIGTKK